MIVNEVIEAGFVILNQTSFVSVDEHVIPPMLPNFVACINVKADGVHEPDPDTTSGIAEAH